MARLRLIARLLRAELFGAGLYSRGLTGAGLAGIRLVGTVPRRTRLVGTKLTAAGRLTLILTTRAE
jgi:hypothetical protein